MINLIVFPLSIIPTILIYLWLRKKAMGDDVHRAEGKKALIYGFEAVLPVMALSAVFKVLEVVIFREDGIPKSFYHAFFVLAFAEEAAKGYMLYRLLGKQDMENSRLDIVTYMVDIAIGFSILESALYAILTNVAQIIVRGLTFPHLGEGFIMGYFAAKGLKEGMRQWFIPAFLIPWILHGSYDFCLSPEFEDGNLPAAIAALLLAALSVALAITIIIYVKREKKKDLNSNSEENAHYEQ